MTPGTHLAWLRIAAVLLLWAEWMGPLRPVHHVDTPAVLALAAVPWASSAALLVGWASRWAAAITGTAVLALSVLASRDGLSGGGVPLDGVEAWWIGLLCLALAFAPCGAAISVDAWSGRDPGPDLGGRGLLRALPSALGLALVVGHAAPVWWDGTRVEQVLVGRYGACPLPDPAVVALAIAWRVAEVGLAVAPWLPRARVGTLGLGAALFGALYLGLYVGTFSAVGAVLLVGALDPRGHGPRT